MIGQMKETVLEEQTVLQKEKEVLEISLILKKEVLLMPKEQKELKPIQCGEEMKNPLRITGLIVNFGDLNNYV